MRALPLLSIRFLAPVAAGALPSPPQADFAWSPATFDADDPVTFVSTSWSHAPMLLQRWRFPADDETTLRTGGSHVHSFPRAGSYEVTLDVMDATLQGARATRTVTVANMPPVVSFETEPSPAYRHVEVRFAASATDRDDDAIVRWTWDFGDGSSAMGQEVAHAFDALGTYEVRVDAVDAAGNAASAGGALRVVDRPPIVTAAMTPERPLVDQPVTFRASGMDPDGPSGALRFDWRFSDGVVMGGQEVTRAFWSAGERSITVRATDAEGASSSPYLLAFRVG